MDERVQAGAFIATLQASFTDFWYLRKKWQRNAERNPLIGVSITGIAGMTKITGEHLDYLRNKVYRVNKQVANLIDINPASRATCVKPSGSTSLVMGTSSGIHTYFAPLYQRTMEVERDSPLGKELLRSLTPQLYEDSAYSPQSIVVKFPIKSPDGASVATSETIGDALDRLLKYNNCWVGDDVENRERRNNVSCSLYARPDDWEEIIDFLQINRYEIGGVSIFPLDENEYTQPVLKELNQEQYDEMVERWSTVETKFDLIYEGSDDTDLSGAVACAGNSCVITSV